MFNTNRESISNWCSAIFQRLVCCCILYFVQILGKEAFLHHSALETGFLVLVDSPFNRSIEEIKPFVTKCMVLLSGQKFIKSDVASK